ncbi:MAG: molybdate ABC transporter substrate-binding protein [Burkholderiaceae bacterium]
MNLPRIRRTAVHTAAVLVALFASLATVPAAAVDLTLLSAGAMREPVTQILAQRSASLPHVNVSFGTAGAIRDRLAKGEKPDVVILPSGDLDGLIGQRVADSVSLRALGETEVGVAVREGAKLPDIATREALRATLLEARKVVIVDPAKGTSGRLVESMFKDLGIADAMRDKTLRVDGGYVVEAVARGEADLGLPQISEILPVKGVTLVGPLPGDLRKPTRYDVAVLVASDQQEDAKALVGYLTSGAARAMIEKSDFKPAR